MNQKNEIFHALVVTKKTLNVKTWQKFANLLLCNAPDKKKNDLLKDVERRVNSESIQYASNKINVKKIALETKNTLRIRKCESRVY